MSTSRLTTPASVSVCLSAHLHLAATYISIIICHVISLLRTTVHLYASFYARDTADSLSLIHHLQASTRRRQAISPTRAASRVLRGTRAREEKIRSSARLLQRLDGPTVPVTSVTSVHLVAATACPTAEGCLTSAGCAVGAESPRAPATAMETCWTSAGYVQTS